MSDRLLSNVAGDMLERWSNGLFRSTLHRVVTCGGDRHSCAFFFEPTFTTVVEALPQCCSPDNPPRFPPTTSGQHLLDRCAARTLSLKLNKSARLLGPALDTAFGKSFLRLLSQPDSVSASASSVWHPLGK